MSEMIERVAKALWIADGGDARDRPWPGFAIDARAAIEAMREPTEAMLRQADNKIHEIGGEERKLWQVMIDAALKDR